MSSIIVKIIFKNATQELKINVKK